MSPESGGTECWKMRHLCERCAPVETPYACLCMDFGQRQKVRSRVLATNGESVGLHIQRGSTLKDGDHLLSDDGKVFVVRAQREPLSVVECADAQTLARAAYHLGNRHVRVQVERDRVSYQTDHVIDDMLFQLGLQVSHRELPFEPEPGAYHKHGSAASEEGSHGRVHGAHDPVHAKSQG